MNDGLCHPQRWLTHLPHARANRYYYEQQMKPAPTTVLDIRTIRFLQRSISDEFKDVRPA